VDDGQTDRKFNRLKQSMARAGLAKKPLFGEISAAHQPLISPPLKLHNSLNFAMHGFNIATTPAASQWRPVPATGWRQKKPWCDKRLRRYPCGPGRWHAACITQ
jgi:hypothetical protein